MTTNYDRRPVQLGDAWLLDTSGRIVGVELQQGKRTKSYLPGMGDDSGTQLLLGSIVLSNASGSGIRVNQDTPAFGWRDLIGVVQARSATGDAPAMYQYRGGNISEFAFALNNSENFEFHMPHDWVPGTDLYIHVHWSHNGTAISGQVQFTFSTTYAKGHNQATFPAETTTTLTVSTPNIATIPQYEHRIEEIQLSSSTPTANQIDTALLEVDGILLVNMKTTVIPTITGGSVARPFVHFVDIHYQSTNLGTLNKAPNFYV